MIPIAEIFGPTIQGEGPDVGLKSIFVRVAGCDFKCDWCDSKFTWNINKDTLYYNPQLLTEYIINQCTINNCKSVILTGGNPCLYDFNLVIDALHDNNIKVGVETQGSIYPEWLSKIDTLVFSPKPPSSNQPNVVDKLCQYIHNHSLDNIAIKIPIFNNDDFNFALDYYKELEYYLSNNIRFYLSVGNVDTNDNKPIYERILVSYEELINKAIESNMDKIYILPQIHTLVWGNKQGV